MSEPKSPKALAITWSKAWGKNFPVGVRTMALEVSGRQPDPISKIEALDIPLDQFEGALLKNGTGKKWGIAYSAHIREEGKVNFTLAHEWGHYLLHRKLEPVLCTQDDLRDFAGADRPAVNIEQQANEFASYLLMPIDDFRAQLPIGPLSMELIVHCAARYGTSLAASAIKLMEFINRPMLCIVAERGTVRWARSSRPALAKGLRVARGTPIPPGSLTFACSTGSSTTDLKGRSWWSDSWRQHFEAAEMTVHESAVVQSHYGTAFSLLDFTEIARGSQPEEEDDQPEPTLVERMQGHFR
jgi:hypothetical protein